MSTGLTAGQEAALVRLTDNGTVDDAQLEAVRQALACASPRHGVGRGEVLAYLGGGLVLAGAVLMAATLWQDLGRDTRVLVLFAAAMAQLVAGLLASDGGGGGRRAAGMLFALGSVVAALSVGAAVTEHVAAWGAVTGLAFAAVTYAYLPALPSLFVAGASAFVLVIDLVLAEARAEPRAAAAALVALGLLWGAMTVSTMVRPDWAGYGISLLTALIGAHVATGGAAGAAWSATLTAGIAVFAFAAYARYRHPILLAGAVIGTCLALPEAVWAWTGESAGAAAGILVAGVVLLIVGVPAVVRHRDSRPAQDRQDQRHAAAGLPHLRRTSEPEQSR
ncbi:hypothetical protein ACFPM7_29965 [Actinokineospora guangxiensis]|uniref:Membrane protein DUF2157 n=1 Tax=Actinokineospora guangxiensis TaxID=1490288 RepID=A0ABW0EX83_9PSEU